jgi:hypothetical protein
MKVLTTPDGAKQLSGWHDTTLNIDCSFGLAADGMTRCVPTDVADAITLRFGDAACTIPVAYYNNSCGGSVPSYVRQFGEGTCPSTGDHYFAVGMPYTTVYFQSGSSCVAQAADQFPSYYAIGSEVPPSTFQPATLDIE